jgi:hypothetical protein
MAENRASFSPVVTRFMTRRYALCFGAAASLVAIFALTLYWFDSRDFYHRHFFDHGPLVRHYERLRLLFIFCFGWLIYAPGAIVLSGVRSTGRPVRLTAWEQFPLGFLIGAAIWSVLLYAIGLAGLYEKPIAAGISLAVAIASIPHLTICVERLAAVLARLRDSMMKSHENFRVVFVRSIFDFILRWASVSTAILAIAVFLLVKGLYPGGGHDYYNHYFPYYVRVVQTGSLSPNDVWYHFFLSKGDGLFFLAMLITDPLGPQLVSASFILCAAFMIYAVLRRIAPTGSLPWIGVLLYFLFFIYTPGPSEFMAQGGWGDMEKDHELTAVLLLGMIWCIIRLFESTESDSWPWVLGLHASITTTIIITLQLGFLTGLYLAGYMLWFALRRQWRQASIAFFGGASAAVLIAAMLAINYDLTGLILDQSILFTWPVANLTKLANWGALFEAITLDQVLAGLSANAQPWSRTIFWLLPRYLRLEIWSPLFAVAALLAILSRWRASKMLVGARIKPAVWAFFWFAGTVALIAAFGGGRSQPISFYRLSSFSYAPMLCLSLALCHFGVSELGDPATSFKKILAGGLIALVLTGIVVGRYKAATLTQLERNVGNILRNARLFWSGRFSLAEAYQNQQGWPGRLPWGGIYPPLEQVWRALPPFTRVWSFHVWTYCMLPDCNFQGSMSFIFSPEWRTVYFGDPEQARAALQAEGLNYFFFSKTMPIEDPIGRSPLFSVDNIDKYLAVRWTDGTNYLLTWPGSGTRPLDDEFISAYHDLTLKSNSYKAFDVGTWKQIADEIRSQEAAGEKIHPFQLPWCQSLTWCFGGS